MNETFDVLVVLGAKVEPDGSPSKALLRRIAHAAALYHAGAAPFLLLSGGQPRGAIAEAEIMRQAALALDVAEGALRVEPLSRNTLENAMFCKPIIQRHGWRKLLVVTDGYHLPRALYTFRRLGLTAKGSAAPPPRLSPGLLAAHGREAAALLVYIWRIERALL
ncbi:MAG TPA: YdcF family protein [Candidatus Sulfotelmatobacter sp.]|jgi:uncharacterized SAM-binding protein YcdF (DUF218 family)|nr:YdcF family protein [Candidatus Sulfotelmatobacter sp.]